MMLARLANFFGVFIFTGLVYGEVMANDTKKCTFIRELSGIDSKAVDEKINIKQIYEVAKVFKLKDREIYKHTLVIHYGDEEGKFSICEFYHTKYDKILGADCTVAMSKYGKINDLKLFLDINAKIRYNADVSRHMERSYQTSNYFLDVSDTHLQKNDLIIKNCNVEIVN